MYQPLYGTKGISLWHWQTLKHQVHQSTVNTLFLIDVMIEIVVIQIDTQEIDWFLTG